jgi:hypothetical protein
MSEHQYRKKQMQASLAERDALMRNPTHTSAFAYWIKRGFPEPVNPSVPLATVHKARLQWLDATDAMLRESQEWLLANGYEVTSQGMPPLTPEKRDAQRKELGKPPLGVN